MSMKKKITNWLNDRNNNENDLVDFLIDECGIVLKNEEEEEETAIYNGIELPRFVDGREVISYPNASAPLLNSIKKKKFKVVPAKLKQFITCHDCGHISRLYKMFNGVSLGGVLYDWSIGDCCKGKYYVEDCEAAKLLLEIGRAKSKQEEMESIDWVKRNETMIDFTIDRSNEPDTEPESDTEYEAYCEICDDYMSDVEQEDYEAGCNSICDGCAE